MSEIENVDISETWLWENFPEAFSALLKDHTTGMNIFWATDSYEKMGDGYGFFDELTCERITGENGLIVRPRALKDRDEQIRRSKDKGEVFTPTWVCNIQNNLIDSQWFGRKDVFNRELIDERGAQSWIPTPGKVEFGKKAGETWRDYVRSPRLEITCGEAPYLASRYDTTTGEFIPVERRVGILDRKLRVICENTNTESTWLKWAITALESTYGYEWQGDSLLIAREALLFSVLEWYQYHFGKILNDKQKIKNFAYRISWNIWQMDGLKYGLPGYEPSEPEDAVSAPALPLCEEEYDSNPRLRLCRIKDWVMEDELQKKKADAECSQMLLDQEFKIIFKTLLNKQL